MSQLFLVSCPKCKAELIFASPSKEKWICYVCKKDILEVEEDDNTNLSGHL